MRMTEQEMLKRYPQANMRVNELVEKKEVKSMLDGRNFEYNGFITPHSKDFANAYLMETVHENIDYVKSCINATLKDNNGIDAVKLAKDGGLRISSKDGWNLENYVKLSKDQSYAQSKAYTPVEKSILEYVSECQKTIDAVEGNNRFAYGNVVMLSKHMELATHLKNEVKLAQQGVLTIGSLNFMIDAPARKFGSSEINQVALSQFVPEKNVNSMVIENVIYDPIRGMTQFRQPSQEFKSVDLLGWDSQSYAPFWFGEYTKVDETYMFMRNVNVNNIQDMMLQDWMRYNQLLLMVRMKHREFDLMYKSLTTGSYQQNDEMTLTLNTTWAINQNGQQFVPVTAPWMIATNDPNTPYRMNPAANPVIDLMTAIFNYKPWDVYRSTYLESGCMIMNPNTYNAFIENPNVQSTIAYQMAQSNGFDQFNMDAFFKFFIPGTGKIKVLVDATVRMNEDYTTTYVCPDTYVLFPFASAGLSEGYAQLIRTLNSQIGGLYNPQPGLFTAIIDQSSLNSVLGMQGNPQIRNYIGCNMNMRLPNPNQNLSLKVA